MARNIGNITAHARPIVGAIKSAPRQLHYAIEKPPPAPFITLSRQPGIGPEWTAGKPFVAALNAALPGEKPWTWWDRELIERVAVDLKLPTRVVEMLDEQVHSWFTDFFESLSFSDMGAIADEATVYARVGKTIRALARMGRVILVGRGGVFLTRGMPGGIHIRLVAPFADRVAATARENHLTPRQAAARIKKMEHSHELFYRRHWPGEAMRPEAFTLTINTAMVDVATAVGMITALARRAAQPAKK